MPRTGLASDQLLEKLTLLAEQKIREEGFDHLKLSLVAKDLGVSHAALYKHVKSKDDLLDLVSRKLLKEIDDKLKVISLQSTEPSQNLQDWFEAYYTLKCNKIKLDPEIYKTFNLAVEQKKAFVKEHLAELNQQLVSILEKCQKKQLYTRFSPEQSARLLLSGTESFHHPHLLVEHKDEDRILELRQILRVLLLGLSQ